MRLTWTVDNETRKKNEMGKKGIAVFRFDRESKLTMLYLVGTSCQARK